MTMTVNSGDYTEDDRFVGRDEDEEQAARESGESTPLLPVIRDPSNLVSSHHTLMHFLRAMIGPGCLSLPAAFKFAGLWTGFALMFVVAYINTHCMSLLVHCAQYLCTKSGKLELDYGHLAKKVFDYGPDRWRDHSKKALYTVNAIVVLYQVGVCSVQFVFMAANLHGVIHNYYPLLGLDDKAYISILLPAIVAVCFIRHLKTLAIISTAGNVFMLAGFVIIFQQIFHPPNQLLVLPAFAGWESLIMAVGSMLYAIEGQANILPLENKMRRPEEMVGWNGVLWTGMSITTCIYAATGFFGYGKYGAHVAGTLTLNMPNTWLFDLIRIILILAVFFGISLQFYVVIEMLWPAIARKLPVSSTYFLPLEYCFRLIIVLITYSVAMIVPQLELIIPLVGITVGSILAFVLPGLFDMVTFWDDRWAESKPKATLCLIKDSILIILGIMALIIGLYSNVRAISAMATGESIHVDSAERPDKKHESIQDDDDDEDIPLLPQVPQGREGNQMISPHRALMGLLKTMVGPGCLSLPYGWMKAGLWVSLGVCLSIGLLNLYCSLQLVYTAHHLCRISGRAALDYGHFAKKVFDHGPSERLKKHSKAIMYFVNAANIFYQIGVCAIQIVFMATNIGDLVKAIEGQNLDMRIYATAVLIPVIGVNLVRELRVLAILAGIANFFLLVGFVIILQACIRQPSQAGHLAPSTNFFDSMLFVGTAMYAFEGQAAILPMENKLRDPTEMVKNCGVLPANMGIVTAIFTALGFFGYSAYGDQIRGTITLNLPKEPFYQTISVTLILAAYIGHVVNMYVVVEMLWPGLRRKTRLRWPILTGYEIHLEIVFRVFLVLATYALAVMVPRVELIVPLMGITAGILIAFIFPPLFEMLAFWETWCEERSRWYIGWKVASNCCIILLGMFVMIFGTYQNIYVIYQTIYNPA